MASRCLSAGQGKFSPVRASNSSSDEEREIWPRRNDPMQKRKRRLLVVDEDDEEEENEVEDDRGREEIGNCGSGEFREEEAEEATPIGNAVRVSGKGEGKVSHFGAFEYGGNRYELEDPVLLCPEDEKMKPYVAIIKDITENISNGNLMLTCQCFIRPENAQKKGGGSCEPCDSRELYYTFDLYKLNADSVMHTCVVNYVPLHKQLPSRREFPGFIVQRVYDTKKKELYNLTDEKFEDKVRLEINHLLNETMNRIGDLPDMDMDAMNVSPMSKSKKEEEESKYHTILAKFHVLTRENRRDYWLKKLLQCVEYGCNGEDRVIWPDSAVSAVTAIERALYKKFPTDESKYNEKMRQLDFNLKNNARLAQRVLKWELKPSVILNMSSIELKEGLTAEEIAKDKPENPVTVQMYQMTDSRCKTCSNRNVSVANKFSTGFRERYELECLTCGHREFVPRERVLAMSIYESSNPKK